METRIYRFSNIFIMHAVGLQGSCYHNAKLWSDYFQLIAVEQFPLPLSRWNENSENKNRFLKLP